MTGNPEEHGPEIPRRGALRHGNPPGDPWSAPRCGAKTRRGTPCGCPAIRGRRRCRLHGGRSPGAPKGNRHGWKHGRRSAAAVAERKRRAAAARDVGGLIAAMKLLDGEPVTEKERALALATLERLDGERAKPPPG